jgi:succinyl-CoA synthetase beta subunit
LCEENIFNLFYLNHYMAKKVLSGFQAEKFLSKYLPVSIAQLVSSLKEIKIKVPLVLKIISKDALHKSDIGGVKIIKSQSEIKTAFNELMQIVKKRRINLEGIMVQKFAEGERLIIGIKKDPVFNHVILFGLGGIFTEVLDDTSIRKCPISIKDANEMISELKASKIFSGFRGKTLALPVLKKALVSVSKIPEKHKDLSELDINPFMLNERAGTVVDARIVFEKN